MVWIGRSGAQRLLFLRDFEGALRQVARLSRRLHPRGRLLQRIFRVADFDANLLSQFFTAQFGLPIFQFGTVLIRLCHPVANRNIQIESDVVIRSGVVERIRQGA